MGFLDYERAELPFSIEELRRLPSFMCQCNVEMNPLSSLLEQNVDTLMSAYL